MEITFAPGLSQAAQDILDKKKEKEVIKYIYLLNNYKNYIFILLLLYSQSFFLKFFSILYFDHSIFINLTLFLFILLLFFMKYIYIYIKTKQELENETVFDAYLRKQREKKKAKRDMKKNKNKQEENESDDDDGM